MIDFLNTIKNAQYFLIFLYFTLISIKASSQCESVFHDDLNGVSGYASLDTLNICGSADTLSYYFLNATGENLQNGEFTLQLPVGFSYAGFVEFVDTNYPITEGDITDLQNPTFVFTELGTDSIQVINVGIVANCDVYSVLGTEELNFNTSFSFIYDNNGVLESATLETEGSIDYTFVVQEPVLVISDITTPDVVISNDSQFCTEITLTQTGIGASLTSFEFELAGMDFTNFDISQIEVNGLAISYNYDPTTMLITFVADASYLPGGSLGENEDVVVEVCYTALLGCDTTIEPIDLVYAANFGCDGTCPNSTTANGTVQYVPSYGANPVVTSTLVQSPEICGDNAIFDVTITSTNTDSLLGLWEDLVVAFQLCEGDALDVIDVRINGNSLNAALFGFQNNNLVIDFNNLTIDPDGLGVGIEDLDGDGFFDELPGGNILNVTIETAIKCQDPQQLTECTALDCSFSQVDVTGLRHCGTPFSTTGNINPPIDFFYGALSITTNNTTELPNGTLGYNFGLGEFNDTTSVNIEFCYEFGAQGIGECQNGNSYFEVEVAGLRSITKDISMNPNSVFFDGNAVSPSDLNTYYATADSSVVVFQVFAGSNNTATNLCYNFTLELDTCLCYPYNYVAANLQVVEECYDCTPDTCNIVRACETVFLGSRRDCSPCVCIVSDEIVEIRRTDYGYADPELTIPLDENSPEVQGDLVKLLPCDSVYIEMEFEILDAAAVYVADRIRFYIRGFSTSGTNFHPALELLPDMTHLAVEEFSFSKTGSTTRIPIDFTGMDCISGSGATYRNINDGFFDGKGLLQTSVAGSTGLSVYNRRPDVLDNQYSLIDIYDRDERAADGGDASFSGDCFTYLTETLMGGLENGDKFHWVVKIPMQKNPYRLLNADIAAQPIPNLQFRSHIDLWDVGNGIQSFIDGSCGGNSIVETYCPPPPTLETVYNVDNCDTEVKHIIRIPSFPPPYDTWYQNEYRPFWEFDSLKIPLIDPFVYAGGDNLTLADGTIVTLTEPVVLDENAFCTTDNGQDYCTSNTGTTAYMWYDASEFPALVLGAGGQPGDSICLSYDLERLCPGPLESPLNYEIFYDYSYLCDYNPGGNYCNRTNANANGNNGFFNLDLLFPVENCPGNTNASTPLFFARDYHLFADTSTILTFNSIGTGLPPLTSTTTQTLLSDLNNLSETNIYEVCVGAGTDPHENVITAITISNTINLLSTTSTTGAPLTFILTDATATTSTYVVDVGTLQPNQCFSFEVETELQQCPEDPSVETKICIKTASSCLPVDLSATLLANGGDNCTFTETCYEYIAGVAGMQAAWSSVPGTPDSPVDLCSTQFLEIVIQNTQTATLTDLDFNIILPNGLIFVPNSFEYAYPGGPTNMGAWTSISDPTPNGSNALGDILTLDDTDMINDIGLSGLPASTAGLDSNRLLIRFQVETVCDEYISNTPLYVESTAADPCEGTLGSGYDTHPGILINNAVPDDYAQFAMAAGPLEYSCEGIVSTCISGVNLSTTGGENIMSTACFTFPDALEYIPSSFTFITPTGYTPSNVVETDLGAGVIEVCFDLPDGIGPQQFFAFEVELIPDPQTDCGQTFFTADIQSDIADQNCVADGSTCSVFINNTVNSDISIISAPPAKIKAIEAVVLCDNDSNNTTYDYTLFLEGISTDGYNGNITIEFYEDSNGNEIIDDNIDVLVNSDVYMINITGGEITELASTSSFPENTSCPLLVKASFDACTCNTDEFYFDLAPTPEFLTPFENNTPVMLCPNLNLELAICSGYDFALDPVNGGTMTNTNGLLTVSINPGFGIDTPVMLQVMSQQDNCAGTFELEIFELETLPPPSGTVELDRVCDGNQLYVIDSTNIPNPIPFDSNLLYTWYLDGVEVANITGQPFYAPQFSGLYTVMVTDQNPATGCANYNSFNIPFEIFEVVDCQDCGK